MLYTLPMRLDKLLCEVGLLSRSEAKDKIKKGLVAVNGITIKDSSFSVDEDSDEIFYNGIPVKYEKFVYYMLNKPAGYVSAVTDKIFPTVIDLLKSEGKKDLFPVGRLDKDTVGLLIITNDGELSHHLTSPRHHVNKTYYIKSACILSKEDIDRLEKGIELDDSITKPAKVRVISDYESELTISEGMYHQVKRMFKAIGNEVLFLKRISIGDVTLDTNLAEGSYRRLTSDEIDLLKGK